MPSIRDQELDEDEWDPSGLNAMSFDVEEGDSEDEDEDGSEDEDTLDAVVELVEEDEEDEVSKDPSDLDVDGLTELERMEQILRSEESLDFAMINNEEE